MRFHAHRPTMFTLAAVVAAVLVMSTALTTVSASAAGEPAGTLTVFHDPALRFPQGMTVGPDGNVWVTNPPGITRITPAGVVTDFTDPSIFNVSAIAAGADGNLWYTNENFPGSIGRITTSGVVTDFTGDGVLEPTSITAGPDGNLWFTNFSSASIGRITPAGVVSNFTTAGIANPRGITAGPDGNLWFTSTGAIGRITPGGSITLFTPAGLTTPQGITAGPDGNLWFTDQNGSIGRSTTSGTVTLFPIVDTVSAVPLSIVRGPDGNLWFTIERFDTAHSVGRITPAGVITTFIDPAITFPTGIVAAPDGKMWFGINGGAAIGQISVGPLGFRITNAATLANGRIAQPYSTTLTTADGVGTIKWKKLSSLPKRLKLKASTGVISGTPKFAGTYTFTVQATYKDTKVYRQPVVKHNVTKTFTITIT